MNNFFSVLLLSVNVILAYGYHKDIAFTARKAIVKDGNYIGYNEIVTDVNVGKKFFNIEYGFFRAERPGLYHFTFQAVSDVQDSFTISLRVDGVPKVFAIAQPGFNQAGNSVTLDLQPNQVVYLYLEPGSKLFEPSSYRGYCTFSGHRITYDPPRAVTPRGSGKRKKKPTNLNNEESENYDKVHNIAKQVLKWDI